jgi:ABC-2 type transport system permease protein
VTEALAFIRAGWFNAVSYRVNTVLSLLSFALTIVPVYFIAGALEPMMAESIADEGSHYFAFLVVGLVVQGFLVIAIKSQADAVLRGIGTGSLEAMLATPIRLPSLLFGLVSYELVWTVGRACLFVGVATVLGMRVDPSGLPAALLVFVLLVAAHVPIGLLAVACVLAFRNATPLPKMVLTGSALLGGMYYPAKVVPSWLQYVSDVLPITYGLRAFRATLLDGASLAAVAPDFLALCVFLAVLMPLGVLGLNLALRYARVSGSLAYA